MSLKKTVLAFFICFTVYFIPGNIFSDNIKKANKYYEKYDYKLALSIYEEVMAKKPSLEVAQKLANCYRFINDTEGAEKAYARVLTFPGFDPVNYKYYADALKQNGKFDEAKANYQLFGEKLATRSEEAARLANATDVAKMWASNPDENVQIENLSDLNSGNSDFSPVQYADGLIFTSDRWFSSAKGDKKKSEIFGWTGNPYLKLYQYSKSGSGVIITPFSPSINADYHNGPATFSSTGDTVYFTRTEVPSGKKKEQITIVKKKIFFAVKAGTNWGNAKALNINNASYSIQHPALSPDGKILYFASDMPGGLGGMDIYASRRQDDGSWGAPENCGANINSSEDDVFPSVRKDGKLYFASKGHVGMGGLDIFTSEGSYAKFALAENLKTPINSTKDDFGIVFTDEFNGYLSSNRVGGKGLDDIYSFSIAPAQKLELTVKGKVIDKTSGDFLPNTEVILSNRTTGEQFTALSDSKGDFSFELLPEMEYVVSGNKDKYYSKQEGRISTKGVTESTIFDVQFELEQAGDTYIVRLNNIYYNFDKWNIRRDAAFELNKVVTFLNKMPSVNIQMRSHTDARGKAIYNKWLSQKRAESAIRYLVGKGVATSRLSAVGLGETEILNRCRDGVRCSIQEHAINRRTEFKVIKVNASGANPVAAKVPAEKG